MGAAGSMNAAGASSSPDEGDMGDGEASAAGSGAAGADAAGAGAGSAGTGEVGTAGSPAAGADGSAEDPVAMCVSALKTKCEMRETAACSSVVTVDVGDLVKAVEIPLGPYGAIMEYNVGQGFEVPEASGESNCAAVAASFGEPANTTENILDLAGSDLKLYTVYRPACMREGEKYPVITWGNGTCGQTEGYGSLLRYVASHGYVVFASNSRYTGNNGAMTKALDFAEAANQDAESVYYNRLDLTKIGAMGHSQGGGATVTAASDERIDALILWNASTSAPKPFLAVSGDADIIGASPASMARDIGASSEPSAWLYYHKVPMTGSVSGHLTLMIQPERVAPPTVAWWDYMLKEDPTARDFFVGASCGLCGQDEDFEYGQNGLE
jgi:pimeloyl-ACP methyl ester carboxylesterase